MQNDWKLIFTADKNWRIMFLSTVCLGIVKN